MQSGQKTKPKMEKKNEIRSAVLQFLANHHVVARAVSCTTGVFTRPIRETNVVMFHAGRCGSTVVGMLLNQHPQINWIGEILAKFREKFGDSSWVWEDPKTMIKMRTNIHPCRTLGLEIKRSQIINTNINESKVIKLLKRIGYEKFIILKRKNYLRKKISEIVASKMGKMNVDKRVKTPKVRMPVSMGKWDVHTEFVKNDTLTDHFERLDKFYKKIEKALKKFELLSLSYEEHVKDDPKKAAEEICKFANLETHEMKIETEKINRKSIKESISNFGEVENFLEGTKYEWMTKDD